MKIVHIDNSISYTGAFKALLGICDDIAGVCQSIVILPSGSACSKALREKNISFINFPFRELRKSAAALFLYVPALLQNTRRLIAFIKTNDIDVIHSNDHFNMVPVLAKKILGKKVTLIVHVRLLPGAYNSALYHYFRRINTAVADHLVAVSEAVYKAYGRPSQMRVIYDRIHLREQYVGLEKSTNQPFRFLYMANYIQGKGQDLALAAFQLVAAQHDSCELHFYGGDMNLQKNKIYKQALERQAGKAGLLERIRFYNFASEVEQVYKQYDASLCFSGSESFSLVCIESQFYGVPVIATRCGGPEEIITHEVNGLLVENYDKVSMAAAMLRLIKDKMLCVQIREAGRQSVQRMMNQSYVFKSLVQEL